MIIYILIWDKYTFLYTTLWYILTRDKKYIFIYKICNHKLCKKGFTFKRHVIYKIIIHNNPSEGENELLTWRELAFQKVQIRKRKSLWAFSRIDTLASSLTRSSIYPHRWRVELSLIIKTLKKTSMKKRSWSSKIMIENLVQILINTSIITCFIG